MMNEVQKLLEDKKCLVTLSTEKAGEERHVVFKLPERQIAPFMSAIETRFKIGRDGVMIIANGESQGFLALPTYAVRAFVMAVVIATCERFGYNKRLIKFDIEGEETDDVTFASNMLNFELNEEDENKDMLLRQLATNAANCPIKFHSDFQARSIALGIKDGYERVTHVLRGGNVYEC